MEDLTANASTSQTLSEMLFREITLFANSLDGRAHDLGGGRKEIELLMLLFRVPRLAGFLVLCTVRVAGAVGHRNEVACLEWKMDQVVEEFADGVDPGGEGVVWLLIVYWVLAHDIVICGGLNVRCLR